MENISKNLWLIFVLHWCETTFAFLIKQTVTALSKKAIATSVKMVYQAVNLQDRLCVQWTQLNVFTEVEPIFTVSDSGAGARPCYC